MNASEHERCAKLRDDERQENPNGNCQTAGGKPAVAQTSHPKYGQHGKSEAREPSDPSPKHGHVHVSSFVLLRSRRTPALWTYVAGSFLRRPARDESLAPLALAHDTGGRALPLQLRSRERLPVGVREFSRRRAGAPRCG